MPVPCDVDAPAKPYIFKIPGVAEKSFQCGKPPRPASQAAVQPDRHHARRCFTLGIEHVKAVFQVLVELFTTVEALGAGLAKRMSFTSSV